MLCPAHFTYLSWSASKCFVESWTTAQIVCIVQDYKDRINYNLLSLFWGLFIVWLLYDLVFIAVIINFNDYFTFFYVKHFELPLCMKCAI